VKQFDDDVVCSAKNANLIAYCQSKGIALKREGKEFVLISHDSVYISANEPHKWYRHSSEQGGLAIDFCMKFLGMTFVQSVKELTGELPSIEIEETKHIELDVSTNQKRVIAYLSKKRGLEYKLITKLIQQGFLRQDKNGNCVFYIYDFNNNKVGAELHGTGDTRFKGLSSEQKGFGFTLCLGQVKQVAYFESAIDLLSFHQLYPKKSDVLLVSMSGLKSVVLQNYMDKYKDAEHILCIDNDEKGRQFALEHELKFVHSKFKDWNEQLIKTHAPSK
jgi:hypothetical protein